MSRSSSSRRSWRKFPSHKELAPAIRRLALALLLINAAVSSNVDPSIGFKDHGSGHTALCTPDELMPDSWKTGEISGTWDTQNLISPPYDCTCNTLKASYFCPNLGDEGYPKWRPQAVSEGTCKVVTRSHIRHNPFPPGFKILFYGNSHLRQVLEGIVCAYSSSVHRRRLTLVDDLSMIAQDVVVDPDLNCRSCVNNAKTMRAFLLDNGCLQKKGSEQACSCDDDNSVFEFDNEAMIHYHFAHKEEDKRIEDALRVHSTKFEDYDAVVANIGNEPRMEVSELLRSAERLQKEGVPLLWLSTYGGEGDVREWLSYERRAFERYGARYLPVHHMVESLGYLTKGVVEGEFNPHFCMPGPPNEIGLLLLRVAWAMQSERDEAAAAAEAESGENSGKGRRR